MIGVGRIACVAQYRLLLNIRQSDSIALFHTLRVHKPSAFLTHASIVKTIYPVRHKLVFRKTRQRFSAKQEKDGVSGQYELIYVNNMNRYYFWCQLFIYGFLTPTVCLAGNILWTTQDQIHQMDIDHPYAMALPGIVFGLGLIFLTNIVSRRSIIRMYHSADKKSYIAITQKWNMVHEKLHFHAKDCIPQSKSSRSTKLLLGGNVLIKDRKFIIRDTDFREPVYYNDIMGWGRAEEDRRERIFDDLKVLIKPKKKS